MAGVDKVVKYTLIWVFLPIKKKKIKQNKKSQGKKREKKIFTKIKYKSTVIIYIYIVIITKM